MKKILFLVISIVFISTVTVSAQNNSENYHVDVHITGPQFCNYLYGYVKGFINQPTMGWTQTQYHGLTSYQLWWSGTFIGPDNCYVVCETVQDSQGNFCFGETNKTVGAMFGNDIDLYIEHLVEIPVPDPEE